MAETRPSAFEIAMKMAREPKADRKAASSSVPVEAPAPAEPEDFDAMIDALVEAEQKRAETVEAEGRPGFDVAMRAAGAKYVPTKRETRLEQVGWREPMEREEPDWGLLGKQVAEYRARKQQEYEFDYSKQGLPEDEAKRRAAIDATVDAEAFREDAMTVVGGRFGETEGFSGVGAVSEQALGRKASRWLTDVFGSESAISQVGRAWLEPLPVNVPVSAGSKEERERGREVRGEKPERLPAAAASAMRSERLRELEAIREEEILRNDSKLQAGVVNDAMHAEESKRIESEYEKGMADIESKLPEPSLEFWNQLAVAQPSDIPAVVPKDEPGGHAIHRALLQPDQPIPMPREAQQQNIALINERVEPLRERIEQSARDLGVALRDGAIDKETYDRELNNLIDVSNAEIDRLSKELSGAPENLLRDVVEFLSQEVRKTVPVKPVLAGIAAAAGEGEWVGKGGAIDIEHVPFVGTPLATVAGLITGDREARRKLSRLSSSAQASYARIMETMGFDLLNVDPNDPVSNPMIPFVAKVAMSPPGFAAFSILEQFGPEAAKAALEKADEEESAVADQASAALEVLAREPKRLAQFGGAIAEEALQAFHGGRVIMEGGPDQGKMIETSTAGLLRRVGTGIAGLYTTIYGRALSEIGLSDRELQVIPRFADSLPELSRWLQNTIEEPGTAARVAEAIQQGGSTYLLKEIPKGVISDATRLGMFLTALVFPSGLSNGDFARDYANTVLTARGFWEENAALVRASGMDPEGPLAKLLVGGGLVLDVAFPFEALPGLPLRAAGTGRLAWKMDAPMRAAGAAPKTRAKLAAGIVAGDIARASPTIRAAKRAERVGKMFLFPDENIATIKGGGPPDLHAAINQAHERAIIDQAWGHNRIELEPNAERVLRQVIEGLGLNYDIAKADWIYQVRYGHPPRFVDDVRPNFAGDVEYQLPFRVRDRKKSLWPRLKKNEASTVHIPGRELQRQLGIPERTMRPSEVFGPALRFAIAETNRAMVPGRWVPVTRRTIVPDERIQWINDKTYITMSEVVGKTPDDLAARIQAVRRSALAPEEARIPLDGGMHGREASGLQSLVRSLVEYGVDQPVPARIKMDGADWNYVTVAEYTGIVEALVDHIAGVGTGRSKAIENMPITLLEKGHEALLGKGVWTPEGRKNVGLVRKYAPGVIEHFKATFAPEVFFERMGSETAESWRRTMRNVGRVPEDLEDMLRALENDWQARSVGAAHMRPGLLRKPFEYVGAIKEALRGNIVNPRILTEVLAQVAPPVRYDARTMPVFDFLKRSRRLVDDVVDKTPRVVAKELSGNAAALTSADMPAFLDGIEAMMNAEFVVGPNAMERGALARSKWAVSQGRPLAGNDASVLFHYAFQRENAIANFGEQVLESFAGAASKEAANVSRREKLDAYRLFYAGDWEAIADIVRGTMKPQEEIGLLRTNWNRAVTQLIARRMAEQRMLDGLLDCVRSDAFQNAESMWKESLSKDPIHPTTKRRKQRIMAHLDALGVPKDMTNVAYRAHIHAAQGLDAALNAPDLGMLIRDADKDIIARTRSGVAVEGPAEAALRMRSHAIFGSAIRTPADIERAIRAMHTEMSVRGIERAALEGPSPRAGDVDDFARSVAHAASEIMRGKDGLEIIKNTDGSTFYSRRGTITNPLAHLTAMNMLDRWGYEMAQKVPTEFVPWEGPSGQIAWLPKEVGDEIAKAFEEAAPLGKSFSGATLLERMVPDSVKSAAKHPASAVTSRMKQAYTIGVLPMFHLPFITMQVLGNTLFTYQKYGAAGAAHILGGSASLRPKAGGPPVVALTNPALLWDVTNAMWGQAPGVAKTRALVTDAGMIYTADQLGAMARSEGLNSSLVSASFERALSVDISQYLSGQKKIVKKVGGPVVGATLGTIIGGPGVGTLVGAGLGLAEAASVQKAIQKVGSAADNGFRAAVFIHEIKMGRTPTEAAKVARDVILDYSSLSRVEKEKLRHIVIFYAYTRRSAASFYWTMLKHPERIGAQVRAIQASHKVSLGEEWRQLTNDYQASRMALWWDKQQPMPYGRTRYLPAQFPIADTITLFGELTNPQTSAMSIFGRLNPLASSLLTNFFFEQTAFMGLPADDPRNNVVEPWVMAYDYALTGGQMARTFDIRYMAIEDPRKAIDEHGGLQGAFVARNWKAWHAFADTWGLARTQGEGARWDQTDLGLLEAIPNVAMSLRRATDQMPPLEGHEIEYMLATGRMQAPKPGIGPTGALMGAIGLPGRPTQAPRPQDIESAIEQRVRMGIEKRAKKE